MEDSALSIELEHDFLPEFNRMLPLPAGDEDRYDDEDRRLGRGTRLRVWRSGPADGPTLRAAAEAEVAEAIEQGEVAEDDRTLRTDNVVELLSGDASIADPPDVDEVALDLGRGRELFAKFHGPYRPDSDGSMPPVPFPDRYGNWPGVKWRDAVEHTLKIVSDRRPPREERDEVGRRRLLPPTTSDRLAMLWLRREKMEEAAAVAAAEEQARRDAGVAAVAELPIVFDDERQNLLKFVVRYHARGELIVPVSGDPLAEAKLMAELERNWDGYGLSENDRADVVAELIRFVASKRTLTRESRIVPTVGYAVVIDGHGATVDVAPAGLRLTIEGGQYVLRSLRWTRSVRMAARDFRDWKRCAQAIFDQVGVEVDDEHRRHWKRWWPSLAAQLLKTVELVEDAQRVREWERFRDGIMASAPALNYAPEDGSPYRWQGKVFCQKTWLIEKAITAGVIDATDRQAFSKLVGEPKNERDPQRTQKWLLTLTAKPPLLEGASRDGDHQIDLATSKDANEPENEG
jgi:hypothetical protein